MNQFVSAEVLEPPHSLQLSSNRDSLMGLAVMEKVIAIFPADTTDPHGTEHLCLCLCTLADTKKVNQQTSITPVSALFAD